MQIKEFNEGIFTRGNARPGSKKILFACVPADGHFSPLTGIAKYLQSLGYDVRWYSSVAYRERLEKLQIPYFLFNKAMEVTGDTVDKFFPERAAIKSQVKKLNFDIVNFFIRRGPEYYEDMVRIHADFPFGLVITDAAFSAIPFITDKMNIPVITMGIFPLTEKSKDLAPNGLALTPAQNVIGKLKQRVLHFIADHILFRQSNKVMHELLEGYGIEAKSISLFDMMVKKSTLFLQSGTPGFEYRRSDLGKNIRYVGALLPFQKESTKAKWFDKRLKEYKKVVLVTQGTVERDPAKIIVPVLEAFKNTDTLVVATTGGSHTKELQQQYHHDNLIIADFIPFNEVMPHADVYITNGGYGGVMLGIENKLPLVVAGVHEGKNEINARIGYFGLGINLKTETPSPDQVKRAVAEVLSNPQYKKNVVALANEFKEYATNELCAAYVKEVLGAASIQKQLGFEKTTAN